MSANGKTATVTFPLIGADAPRYLSQREVLEFLH